MRFVVRDTAGAMWQSGFVAETLPEMFQVAQPAVGTFVADEVHGHHPVAPMRFD